MNDKLAIARLEQLYMWLDEETKVAIDIAVLALEKQIPEEPAWMDEKEVHKHKTGDKCSACGEPLYWSPKARYCPCCGQRWADYDD